MQLHVALKNLNFCFLRKATKNPFKFKPSFFSPDQFACFCRAQKSSVPEVQYKLVKLQTEDRQAEQVDNIADRLFY